MNIEVLADSASVAQKAASIIADEAQAAIATRGTFVIALGGRRTPWLMLRDLAGADCAAAAEAHSLIKGEIVCA